MILVTGGTGLVGSHLLYKLALKDEKIRAIYRTKSSLDNVKKTFSYYTEKVDSLFSKIEWLKADITEVPSMIPAFVDVDYVYHCAAFISFDPKDYREMRKVNIYGTAIIANLAIDAKIKKLCFVSSIAAVGEARDDNFTNETCEWNKDEEHSGYSITKYGAEMEIWRASQENIDVVIINPGVILGNGFWNTGSSKMFTKIHNGFKYYTEGITGYVSLKDVVNSMVLLLNSNIKNERFVIVSQNVSFKYILTEIAKKLNKKPPKKSISRWHTEILWRISWFFSIFSGKNFLSKNAAKSLHNVTHYSSKKIIESLNLEFTPIEKTIEEVAANYSLDL